MRLNGNKVLITGATSGIGEALLRKFLSLDNEVIALGRDEEKLKTIAQMDTRVIPFACDLGKTKELDRLKHFISQQHPNTNILINNAGIQYNYSFQEESELLDKIEDEVRINFLAPLQLIALLLPILNSNANAAIVNVSSGLGLVPKMQAPVYCGTKGAIHIFTKALRYQFDHPKVFKIIPPLVDTRMTAGRGKGKISADQLANEFIKAFKRDKFEINIGKVKILRLIHRISPRLADRIMKKGV